MPAKAQPDADNTHPVLQKRPPREVLNSDLLALPERERESWVHGALSLTAHVLAEKDAVLGRCYLDWYFKEGNGSDLIAKSMSRYPDAPATATIIALAQRVCDTNRVPK